MHQLNIERFRSYYSKEHFYKMFFKVNKSVYIAKSR